MGEYLKTALVAAAAGELANAVGLPIPWTLGPIAGVAAYTLKTGRKMLWSDKIRSVALIILGYMMGRPFTVETCYKIVDQLPMMLLATIVTVVAGVAVGYFTNKRTGLSLASCLLGCVPGGLSQMVLLAEEMNDADQTAVAIMQTVRMLAVVFIVPFIALHVISGDGAVAAVAAANHDKLELGKLAAFLAVAAVGAVIGRWLRLPTAFLLGPIIATAAAVLATGVNAPLIPKPVANIAQLCVGASLGAGINLAKVKDYHGLQTSLAAGSCGLLAASFAMALAVVIWEDVDFMTAFLATAPGGITEMGITALMVGADISTMTAYQLARLLFIMLVFPSIVKGILYMQKRRAARPHGDL